MRGGSLPGSSSRGLISVENLALLYVALPNVLFLQFWIVAPWGWLGAAIVTLCVLWTIHRTSAGSATLPLGRRWWLIVIVATGTSVCGAAPINSDMGWPLSIHISSAR